MKIDRLLQIIIYLMNYNNVSARQLAERFHVSIRTIQRDMISIAQAGIPVYSDSGVKGGYSILPEYKMNNQLIKKEDNKLVMKALESLATSYQNKKLTGLIEKYRTIIKEDHYQSVYWDFGVTKENKLVQTMNQQLEEIIPENRIVKFTYRNIQGYESDKEVQPLAIYYKWYAWYLFAYLPVKDEYRTYKVARIRNLQNTKKISYKKHPDIENLMRESEQKYYGTCVPIDVCCKKEDKLILEEYFSDAKLIEMETGDYKMTLNVPATERLWQALLLSFGDKVRIIGPPEYKDKLIDTARNFLSNYDI